MLCRPVAALLLLVSCQSAAEVVPAKYFADGMIIQRDELVTVWGSADPGEKVKVNFLGNSSLFSKTVHCLFARRVCSVVIDDGEPARGHSIIQIVESVHRRLV